MQHKLMSSAKRGSMGDYRKSKSDELARNPKGAEQKLVLAENFQK